MLPCCIERARFGDRAATRDLVEKLRPRVERMALYYARRCGEDADDLLQEAWLGLLQAVPNLDLRIGSPEQHLIQRAKWRMLDHVKRARLRRCAPLDLNESEPAAPPTDHGLESASMDQFLAGLKAPQRAVLQCLLAGLTWREAGRVLGCTSANVAYYMRQIRSAYAAWEGETVRADRA